MAFQLEQYLKDLEYIINIDSGSDDIEGNNRMAEFFADRFRNAGFDTEILRAGEMQRPVVVSKTPGAEEFTFYLGGHTDTVFPKGTAKERPFRMEEGIAYGPGTVDMKAGALLILYIAKEIIEKAPQISLCIVLNSDEEIGSKDSVDILRAFGSKCRQALIFEGGRKEGRLVNERKGIAKYEIQIDGIASHAGTAPRQGASAIVELAKWIVRLDKLKNYNRGTTINIGIIEGGTALNVVAPKSCALMEVRYVEESELKRVERALKKLTEHPYTEGTCGQVKRLSHYLPLVPTEETHRLMKRLEDYNLEYVKAGGTSDANRLASLGIPIIDGCGPQGGFPHSEKEFLSVETVTERFDLFTKIILDVGSDLAPQG